MLEKVISVQRPLLVLKINRSTELIKSLVNQTTTQYEAFQNVSCTPRDPILKILWFQWQELSMVSQSQQQRTLDL